MWLEARRSIWEGTDEAFILGDMNLDWTKQGDAMYRNSKMLKNLERELAELGWAQLVKQNTHFSNRNGAVSESLIDHIWTNSPVKVIKYGQEEMATSDHQLVWVDRSSRNLVEKVKETEKRLMKNLKSEDLKELCRQERLFPEYLTTFQSFKPKQTAAEKVGYLVSVQHLTATQIDIGLKQKAEQTVTC